MKKRKINICYIIIFSMIIYSTLYSCKVVKAYSKDSICKNYVSQVIIPEKKNKTNINNLQINAKAYIALDANSKVVLAEKNSEIIMPMASTTKIITALVALNHGDLDKVIEISSRAAAIHGSTVGYRKGEKVTLKELLYGLMLRSGNDAAIAIAEGISGSVEEFVKLMNEYAAGLGLIDTHFHTPHGLDNSDHYSTAYDLAVVTAESKKHKLFDQIVSSKDVDGKSNGFTRSYHNINKILWKIPEANGVKTGYTGGAGKCLVTSVNNYGNDVIIVVLNSPSRWNETIKINEYVKKNFEYKKLYSKGEIIGEAPRDKKNIKLTCSKDIVIPIKKDCNYKTSVKVPEEIKDDVAKGDKIGSIFVFKEDKLIFSESLVADNNYKLGIFNKNSLIDKFIK
ncbi:D-alanyl-D-alanine carboxypeptidase [Clostridium tetanomorphum]|nr:D-alanyl-D-alanine carboxypeptidase family protein [Clostridium tetanomorphum]KAJ51455.1 D-alanyl-D-alanine carboxypeptidase [Clostridium tetanomorphum DSM 665]MBP1863875.1 D-alanyl-D-alanine carboxypeptidase [Clostridium tetanomorphum]NRS84953.1 D-alanyl-D-alanine carboxypeptidase [Clostridium tetanomorphum]NRZ98169.1 D-alanyl-D-alanine carboxypeptidase [Clostridium tetanomorphum]SQB91528.1 D-alanyl-D-alanine carboxypeptidase [Clostridium tetanomorphum]